jgi:hypothetical protein
MCSPIQREVQTSLEQKSLKIETKSEQNVARRRASKTPESSDLGHFSAPRNSKTPEIFEMKLHSCHHTDRSLKSPTNLISKFEAKMVKTEILCSDLDDEEKNAISTDSSPSSHRVDSESPLSLTSCDSLSVVSSNTQQHLSLDSSQSLSLTTSPSPFSPHQSPTSPIKMPIPITDMTLSPNHKKEYKRSPDVTGMAVNVASLPARKMSGSGLVAGGNEKIKGNVTAVCKEN